MQLVAFGGPWVGWGCWLLPVVAYKSNPRPLPRIFSLSTWRP